MLTMLITVAMTANDTFIFTVGTRVKECFKKKQKELLSPLMTLYIPSFGITVGPNSYIGSDRMLQTIADLWELPRNNAEKAKVILCIYCKHGNICWAKLLHISWFSRVL